jgi:hypothetical protein
MDFDDNVPTRIRCALAAKRDIEERRIFGGIGLLLDGNLLVSAWKESLVVRKDHSRGSWRTR